jgi:hypothetical protein
LCGTSASHLPILRIITIFIRSESQCDDCVVIASVDYKVDLSFFLLFNQHFATLTCCCHSHIHSHTHSHQAASKGVLACLSSYTPFIPSPCHVLCFFSSCLSTILCSVVESKRSHSQQISNQYCSQTQCCKTRCQGERTKSLL